MPRHETFNLKNLKRSLLRIPLLGDCTRFARYRCLRCSQASLLDSRVFTTRAYQIAKALRADYVGCPHCARPTVSWTSFFLLTPAAARSRP